MDFNTLVRQALDKACGSLVPDAIGTSSVSPPELCIAAIIGFSGDGIRGTLGATTSQSGLGRLTQNMTDELAAEHGEDALGEFANLLLGDIKRSFSAHGANITLSTPLVVRGSSIEICGRAGAHWVENTSQVGSDRVTVWIDAHVEPTLELHEEPNGDTVISQGDALMF